MSGSVSSASGTGPSVLAFVPAWLRRTERFYDLTGALTYLTVVVIALDGEQRRDAATPDGQHHGAACRGRPHHPTSWRNDWDMETPGAFLARPMAGHGHAPPRGGRGLCDGRYRST
jgi:hypothetical protein